MNLVVKFAFVFGQIKNGLVDTKKSKKVEPKKIGEYQSLQPKYRSTIRNCYT